METAELVVKLVDAVTAPARLVGDQLKKVSELGEGLKGKFTELNQATELVGKAFDALGAGIDALKEAGEDLLHKFEEFEDVAKVFQLKEGERGNEVLEDMLGRMKDVGIASEDALGIAKSLGREFSPASAKELSLVVADVRGNLRLSAQETRGFADELVSLGARATVGARQVRGLEKMFGGTDAVKEIAAATGESVQKVAQELKKGTLPTDQLVKGLRQAQLDLAGTKQAGDAAQKSAATSVTDQVQRLKNVVAEFGETLAKDLFGGNDAAEGLKNMGDQLKRFLESAEVQSSLKALAQGLKDVAHWAGERLPGVLSALGSAMRGLKAGWDWLTGGSAGANATLAALAGAGAGLALVMGALLVPLAAVAAGFVVLALPVIAVVAALAAVGVAIYEVVAHWGDLKAAVAGAVASVVDSLSGAWAYVTGWAKGFYSIGADAVQGLVDGIRSLASGPIEAVKGIAQGVESAFKSALGIHSPSVVMAQAGEDVARGVQQGIDGGRPAVNASSSGLAVATHEGFAQQASAGDGVVPGGRGNVSVFIDLDVNVVNHDGGQLAQDDLPARIRDEAERGVRLALSRAQLQG